MDIKTRIKLKKCKKVLAGNKFTIDQNQILNGNLRMIPDIKILYMQSKKDPNIFQVKYIYYIDYDDDNEERYYCSIPAFEYPFIINYDGCITQVWGYNTLGEWNNVNRKIYSFFENCLPSDIYEYDDFINILKMINDEITDYLYKTGNYKIDTENWINNVEDNFEFKILSDEITKKLIKKVHREYMDSKMSNSMSE